MIQIELLASVQLSEGVFELLWKTTPKLAYDAITGASRLRARIRTGSGLIPIDSLGAFVRWAMAHGLHLPTEISKAPAVFARFTASRELGLRVLEDPTLYDFLDERFAIAVARDIPRVEGQRLLFVVGKFPFGAPPAIWRVAVDLTNGSIEQTLVPPLQV